MGETLGRFEGASEGNLLGRLEGYVLGAPLGIPLGIELGEKDGEIVGLHDMDCVAIFDTFAVILNPCPWKTSSNLFCTASSRVALAKFSEFVEGSVNSTVISIDT